MNISLNNEKSIKEAIKELKEYRQTVERKSEIFVTRLMELGIPIVDSTIARTEGDSDLYHVTRIEIKSFGEYTEARLIVEGEDIAFIEFGAGVHYNGEGSPRKSQKGSVAGGEYKITGGKEIGYTIGSYGHGQGKKDGWVYIADDGGRVFSQGTKASMPIYHATMEIINNIARIAKEVFDG